MRPRTVFLTGASSGIGRALALEYARRGTQLALLARRKDVLDQVADETATLGPRARVYAADVADTKAVTAAVHDADQALDGLDVVIANAGLGVTTHAAKLDLSEVTTLLAVNTQGAIATLLAAVPAMLHRKRGQLVGVSSLAGRRGMPSAAAYSASKAALSTFLETARIDLAPKGIRVSDVQPGFVETPMTAKNRFPMPFMWPADRAARFVADRLEDAPALVAFPWQLAMLTSLSRLLPPVAFDAIMRRTLGKK